jgi:hypothetical protein
MPLEYFYSKLTDASASVQFVAGSEMPEPYRYLLMHASDMTPRLRDYHQDDISLQVVNVEQTPEYVMRLVILRKRSTGEPVEIGAIGILLDGFGPEDRALIQAGQIPLGGILESRRIPHSSSPKAYFQILPDQFLHSLLGIVPDAELYGRCNALTHADGIVFADIVEILPPTPLKF